MTKPKIVRQPTPDDISDIEDIYNDMMELIYVKHADKQEYASPSLIHILAISLPTKEDLNIAIEELQILFDVYRKKKKEARKKKEGKKDV